MIVETLTKDLYEAQKAKAAQTVLVIRYLLTKIKEREIELRVENKPIDDAEALTIIKRQVKKRKNVILELESANRPDLLEKEKAELEIVEAYFSKFSNES